MKTTANKKIKLINIEKLEFEILEPINTNEILVSKMKIQLFMNLLIKI